MAIRVEVKQKNKRKWLRRLFLCGFLGGFCLAAAWFFRAPICIQLADWWIVDEEIESADAIVVLGGGIDYRPFKAAELFNEGHAPLILVGDVEISPSAELGVTKPETEKIIEILKEQGVPEDAIVRIGNQVTSTRDEAEGIGDWAKENEAKKVIVPTDLFHTKRAQWIIERELKPHGAEAIIVPIENRRYTRDEWWQSEHGLIGFQNEVVKYVFYRIKF